MKLFGHVSVHKCEHTSACGTEYASLRARARMRVESMWYDRMWALNLKIIISLSIHVGTYVGA